MPNLLHVFREVRPAPLPYLCQRRMLFLLLLNNQQRKVLISSDRACDKCAYHYSDPKRERFKQDSLNNLTNLCVQYLSNKFKAEKDLKYL